MWSLGRQLPSPCLRLSLTRLKCRRLSSCSGEQRSVCIVGSGPAGFYVAQHLLAKASEKLSIDVIEKLPVPFGLVRFGVAPDHPEVKHVINTFTRVATHPRFRFLGNVGLGQDVSLQELRSRYDAVVLAYGAAKDRKLDLENEDGLKNVVSARSMVGWYNGLPESSSFNVDLSKMDKCLVVGVGNVALDVARILLSSADDLKHTDITDKALSVLSESRIRHVTILGRRGPLQVAFTIKELRELVKLKDCRAVLEESMFSSLQSRLNDLPRPRRRLTELLIKTARESSLPMSSQTTNAKSWALKLLRTPKALITNEDKSSIKGLEVNINTIDHDTGMVDITRDTETIPCDLLVKSIGYESVQVDPSVPFDKERGLVPNTNGVVHNEPGLFVSGWLATGPRGVIVDTMNDAFVTASKVIEYLCDEPASTTTLAKSDNFVKTSSTTTTDLKTLLIDRGVKVVDFVDWTKIDAEEQRLGAMYGKPREKITSVSKILEQVERE